MRAMLTEDARVGAALDYASSDSLLSYLVTANFAHEHPVVVERANADNRRLYHFLSQTRSIVSALLLVTRRAPESATHTRAHARVPAAGAGS